MARIDKNTIEGFDGMTPEQKVEALLGLEIPDSAEIERLKASVSKANTEAANWKRKHNDLLSAEEQKKQEEAEKVHKVQRPAVRGEELQKAALAQRPHHNGQGKQAQAQKAPDLMLFPAAPGEEMEENAEDAGKHDHTVDDQDRQDVREPFQHAGAFGPAVKR